MHLRRMTGTSQLLLTDERRGGALGHRIKGNQECGCGMPPMRSHSHLCSVIPSTTASSSNKAPQNIWLTEIRAQMATAHTQLSQGPVKELFPPAFVSVFWISRSIFKYCFCLHLNPINSQVLKSVLKSTTEPNIHYGWSFNLNCLVLVLSKLVNHEL